jgi:Holliday junction DNA helicase RuvA
MIDYITGKLVYKQGNIAILENNGIGYKINITIQTFEKLPDLGETIKLYTNYFLKDEQFFLYGFFDNLEREAFNLLSSINGIGAKTALMILSSVNVTELYKLITQQNVNSFKKMPGIGQKTAERIIFELKDKIRNLSTDTLSLGSSDNLNKTQNEAIQALIALGYNKASAEKAVNEALRELNENELTIENLIKKSLRFAFK